MEALEQLDWASKFFLKISGAALCVIIFGLVLAVTSGSGAVDQSGNTNISVTVPVSCSLSSTAASYDVTMAAGTLNSNIGNTKINAYCNDSNGYVIYSRGAGTGTDKSDMVSSVGSSYNIETGTATSGSTSAWAMKITAGSGTTPPTIQNNFNSFHTVPSDYTAVALRQSSTDMSTDTSTSGSYINATYQVYISSTQPAGNYTGKVAYVMLHPSSSTSSITLEDALASAGATKQNGYYTMQSLTPSICSTANVVGEASQIQLIDTRDNKLYWVTKTEDERCWMTQNLDLDLSSTTALTSENTDLNVTDTGAYSSGYSVNSTTGVISWTPANSTIDASSNMTTTSTSGSISGWSSNTAPYSVNVGNVYQSGTLADVTSCNYLTTACSAIYKNTAYDTNGEHGHVGNYYSWSAAIASNDSSSITTSTLGATENNPENSICPKNWELPVIDNYTSGQLGNNDFYNLDYYYNSGVLDTDEGLMNAPLYFARSGYVSSSSLDYSGSVGLCWSSTVYSSSFAYNLIFYSGNVDPTSRYRNRGGGFSVRCVVAN